MRAPLHPRESERLSAVRQTGVVDAPTNPLHDAVVRMAAELCRTPIAAISLVDTDRQWFEASTGLDCRETPREQAFCAYTILGDQPLVVPDATRDGRFVDNGLVTGKPGIRFYAGVPLLAGGLPLGSLCVIDTTSREISRQQLDSLRTLAGFVSAHLELSLRTEQLRSERSLNQQLVDQATDFAMITLGADGAITSWSPGAERLLGYTQAEVIGRHIRCIHLPEAIAAGEPEAALAEARSAGRVECRGWRQRKDGSRVHVTGAMRALIDPSGDCLGFVKVTRDDTESWRTARELERRTAELEQARCEADDASRSKSEFLANMSHEIRTPMTAILGFAEILASEADCPPTVEERREHIETIRRNGEHLLAIINDILDISKIEAGKMSVELAEIRPEEVVRQVVSLMEVRAKSKGLRLTVEVRSPIPPRVCSDAFRLRQILLNLVGNAVKFTETGSVTLRLSGNAGGELQIDVEDTGIGLDESRAGELFQAFTQADASTTRRFGGTGLGLHISQRLAHLLGGAISVRSRKGQGSTFALTLPVRPAGIVADAALAAAADAAPAPIVAGAPIAAGQAPLQGLRVLLAEDGPDNQRLIAHHLRRAGATVEVAANGRLAMTALTADGSVEAPLVRPLPYDLILTDMQMPEMDGYQLARMLRAKGWDHPILALTAHAMADEARRCVDAGCDRRLTKPIDKAQLIEACRICKHAA